MQNVNRLDMGETAEVGESIYKVLIQSTVLSIGVALGDHVGEA